MNAPERTRADASSAESRPGSREATHPPPKSCRNCGGSLELRPPPAYCPSCGQETVLHEPSFFEFVHEFLDHYVALEGALWRSLGTLLRRPGGLTNEYLAGRRRRYVLPLRLFLTASFVFFLAFKTIGGPLSIEVVAGVDAHGRPITEQGNPAEYAALQAEMQGCIDHPDGCPWYRTLSARLWHKTAERSGNTESISHRLVGLLPYAVFLLLPVFAGLVRLAHRKRRIPYGAHFVFGLHLHTLFYLAMLVALVLSTVFGPAAVVLGVAASMVYGLLALRTVYASRWPKTLARGVLIAVSYGLVLFVTNIGLAMLSVALD